MNKIESEALKESVDLVPSAGIARRRLLRAGLAAAPVVLAVSGRSAMATAATGNCAKGLSPMAWNSIAPDANGNCAVASHTVLRNVLGKSPGNWRPNKEGKTFQAVWPSPTCIPFRDYNSATIYREMSWTDIRWDTGTKFNTIFGGSEARSFSRILITESGMSNPALGLRWFLCAAYLNAATMNGKYALTVQEVLDLAGGKLGTQQVFPDVALAFLKQTMEV